LLVQLLLDGGFTSDAELLLAQGQTLSPQSIDMARSLAVLQAQRGAGALALATLEKSRDFAAGDAEYLGFMAGLCQQLGQHDKANALLEAALGISHDDARWLYAQWVSRRALGNVEGARVSGEAALATGYLSTEQSRQIKSGLKHDAQIDAEDEDNP